MENNYSELLIAYATLVGNLRGIVVSMREEPLPAGYLEETIRKLSADASLKFGELVGSE